MKISFNLNYHTQWGEALYICGDVPELGGGDPTQALEMKLTAPGQWVAGFEVWMIYQTASTISLLSRQKVKNGVSNGESPIYSSPETTYLMCRYLTPGKICLTTNLTILPLS